MLAAAEQPRSVELSQGLRNIMHSPAKAEAKSESAAKTNPTAAAWRKLKPEGKLVAAEVVPEENKAVLPEALATPSYRVAQQIEAPQIAPKSVAQAQAEEMIDWVLEPAVTLKIEPPRSKIIRTREPVTRLSVTDPEVLEIVQFSPTEFELIGGATGQTSLSFWFGDPQIGGKLIRYFVEVAPNEAIEDRRNVEYGILERKINELFPNSMVQLIPVADKLIVRGQAPDAEQATQIMAVIRGQGGNVVTDGQAGRVDIGPATVPFPGVSDLPPANVINMLQVTGEMQVMLKVRVAELTRSANREMGVDFVGVAGDFTWESLLGLGGAVRAVLDTEDVLLIVEAIKTNSYGKVLAEPNLVTLSGHSANFLAGGEFAVPVVVGVEGAAAATANFRSFGTQLTFTPTVLNRDRIRLQVAPSLSSVNRDELEVDGIPGLNSRSVSTTVDLREGQWLAIAGLLQDEQRGSSSRVPFVGDVPVLGTLFSHRTTDRDETELLVLVSPELVHPLEAEEAPPILPGMEVTEPSDSAFFFGGRLEGNPYRHYRSTVAAEYHRQQGDARRATKLQGGYQETETYYVQGGHGFSE
jgi:pilus assembly protein CpaC